MKAARIHNFGGPEVIVLEDVPRPMPATGDVLVRVENRIWRVGCSQMREAT